MALAVARRFLQLVAPLALFASTATAQCAGDCNLNGNVAVNELVSGVRIALERANLDTCASFDINDNGRVAVNELIAAVGNALNGCGFAGIYTASVPLDDGSHAEIELRATANHQITGTLRLGNAETAQLAQANPGNLSGEFDPVTGSFLVTGTVSGPSGPVSIRLSGRLGAELTLEIDGRTYIGAFASRSTPTPTLTPTPQGTVHIVKVGQPQLPFDPEVLEINPGETVTWMWVEGTHSVRSAALNAIGQPSCTANGLFDSGVRSTGSFSYTFTSPGRYGFHCAVDDHCAADFEFGYIEVRGTPTATPTRTSTPSPTFAVPTPTPTAETIGGVSTRLLGFFNGTATVGIQTVPARLQILVDDFGALVNDLSASPLLFPSSLRMTVESPTSLLYETAGPPPTSLSLSLDERSHVVGRFAVNDPIMPHLPIDFDLVREQ
jgi:plastocyanin